MWFLFIVPVAILGASTALFGLVNGGTIVVITLAADQWQRRRGHKPGEGVFTDREGGHVFGLKVARATSDLGEFLAGMAEAFPEMFGEFTDKSYDLTESEGEMLRSMVNVAQARLEEYLNALGQMTEAGEDADTYCLRDLQLGEGNLRLALAPVARYLREVPASRVRAALS